MFKKVREVVSSFKEKKNEDLVLKENFLETVRHHKQHCDEDCGISLFLLKKLAERAGLNFTKEENNLFF